MNSLDSEGIKFSIRLRGPLEPSEARRGRDSVDSDVGTARQTIGAPTALPLSVTVKKQRKSTDVISPNSAVLRPDDPSPARGSTFAGKSSAPGGVPM